MQRDGKRGEGKGGDRTGKKGRRGNAEGDGLRKYPEETAFFFFSRRIPFIVSLYSLYSADLIYIREETGRKGVGGIQRLAEPGESSVVGEVEGCSELGQEGFLHTGYGNSHAPFSVL